MVPPSNGRAEHRDVVLAAAAHVLQVGRLEEGVDAGEVRQLAAGEGRDALVDDGVRAGQAELEAAGDLLLPLGGGQLGLALDGGPRLGAVAVVQRRITAIGHRSNSQRDSVRSCRSQYRRADRSIPVS